MATLNNKKVRSADAKRLQLRSNFWPDVKAETLWLRKNNVGFTTIPRTMSLIGRIMDQAAGKGVPVFGTYLALWCRVFDEAFVEVRNDREMAFESGFSGGRGEVTWRSRMRILEALGFIQVRAGLASEFQYVLIFNPIKVIAAIYAKENLPEDMAFMALKTRLIEVGANDLEPEVVKNDDDDEL